MSQNLKFDPTKRDYVLNNGSSVNGDILDSVYIAIQIPQGQWLYGSPDQGSLLFTLQNKKRTVNIEQQFAAYSKDAINRQLVDTNQATAVGVQNLSATRTGTSNRIGVVPNESNLSDQLNFTPL